MDITKKITFVLLINTAIIIVWGIMGAAYHTMIDSSGDANIPTWYNKWSFITIGTWVAYGFIRGFAELHKEWRR